MTILSADARTGLFQVREIQREQNGSDGPYARYIAQITDLVQRYVDQLTIGCNHEKCVEVLCHTGRSNVAQRRIRKYTHSAAKSIAIAVCSMPNPQLHYCQFFDKWSDGQQRNKIRESSKLDDSLHDSSSLTQLIAESGTMQLLARGALPTASFGGQRAASYQVATSLVNGLYRRTLDPCRRERWLQLAVLPITQFTDWLVSLTAVRDIEVWSHVNDQVGLGRAYPRNMNDFLEPSRIDALISILDLINNDTNISLFENALCTVFRRMDYESTPNTVQSHRDVRNFIRSFISQVFDSEKGFHHKMFAIMVWVKALIVRRWNGKFDIDSKDNCYKCLLIYDVLRQRLQDTFKAFRISEQDFTIQVLAAHISSHEVARMFIDQGKSADEKLTYHLTDFPCIYAMRERAIIFRTINHLRMRRAHTSAETAMALRRRTRNPALDSDHSALKQAEQHYLLLSVSRRNALSDTIDQLWQRKRGELLLPLRIRLGENEELEIGHDLGGVQIEFFNLICRQAFAEDVQMFITEQTTGCCYFKPCSLQPLRVFEFLGLLLALAIYNGITLPIRLPLALYMHLLGNEVCDDIDLDMLNDMWPVMSKSLQQIRDSDGAGFDFSFPIEANGLHLTANMSIPIEESSGGRKQMLITETSPIMHHPTDAAKAKTKISLDSQFSAKITLQSIKTAWPGWNLVHCEDEPQSVTSGNVEQYLSTFKRWLLFDSVAPQLEAFKSGLFAHGVLDKRSLSLFSATELKSFVEGSSQLEIGVLMDAARYEGYNPKSKYIHAFWAIVRAWPEGRQKQLLKFVTATERVPVAGAGGITFIIKKSDPGSLTHLPTSSTCFGTLFLPRYPTFDMLADRLNLAIDYGSEGFGTG